jgi:ABC-type histidine transport system ATPase subunit
LAAAARSSSIDVDVSVRSLVVVVNVLDAPTAVATSWRAAAGDDASRFPNEDGVDDRADRKVRAKAASFIMVRQQQEQCGCGRAARVARPAGK